VKVLAKRLTVAIVEILPISLILMTHEQRAYYSKNFILAAATALMGNHLYRALCSLFIRFSFSLLK
jgi:hypothetical protein